MIGVGVVLALIVVLRLALAGVRPAVILRVRQRGNGLSIKGIERIEPGLIVKVCGIGIVGRTVRRLATVLKGVKRGAKALKHVRACGHEMDRAGVIAKRSGHCIWNIVLHTRVLRRFENRRARAFQCARDCGSRGGLLAIRLGSARCRRDSAQRHLALSRDTIMKLANSLAAEQRLRQTFLSAAVIRKSFGGRETTEAPWSAQGEQR
jgi:hypothetical protein